MPNKEAIILYDTTLRDGQQTQGVDFSVVDKIRILEALDVLGIDYVEGGWPGANPTDSAFFEAHLAPKSRLTAFGMTKRSGYSAENDDILAQVLNAKTASICLVGKTHDYHVRTALGITLEENLENIHASIAYGVRVGREVLFDAEHFFDGYKDNPDYALDCLRVAQKAGARWLVLCDTNGGIMPDEARRIIRAVIKAGFDGASLGIHAHNDTGQAVAISLAAIDEGVRQIQGTLNGIGERCGNADLTSLIATLKLKPPYCERYKINVSDTALAQLTHISRQFDEIINRAPSMSAPYVGMSAFAHKAGLHASAILKDPKTYEHIDPVLVGNDRIIPMSNQAGLSNLRQRLDEAGLYIAKDDPRLSQILNAVKIREDQGYAYDGAAASFEILARRMLGVLPKYFEVVRYRVMVERLASAHGDFTALSEAIVVVKIGQEKYLAVSESLDEYGNDRGPVNALWRAMSKDMGPYRAHAHDIELVDFKVRISGIGTEAVTRVLIESMDKKGRRWSTIGVSANIVDASFDALLDAVYWKFLKDNVKNHHDTENYRELQGSV